jgi:hypothetical protein
MKATGDAGGCNGRHEKGIMAEVICPERLANISVKV